MEFQHHPLSPPPQFAAACIADANSFPESQQIVSITSTSTVFTEHEHDETQDRSLPASREPPLPFVITRNAGPSGRLRQKELVVPRKP